jgi:enamine deaminase RidA (YjgF/YER057c/UK114 family)
MADTGKRMLISGESRYEPIVGYSRAVRVGNQVFVSGTTATRKGEVVAPDDPYTQAKVCIEIIGEALAKAGAKLEHVVRTTIYVTDIRLQDHVARAHGEVFGTIRPASTMVEVSALVDPAMLVEISADAVITD